MKMLFNNFHNFLETFSLNKDGGIILHKSKYGEKREKQSEMFVVVFFNENVEKCWKEKLMFSKSIQTIWAILEESERMLKKKKQRNHINFTLFPWRKFMIREKGFVLCLLFFSPMLNINVVILRSHKRSNKCCRGTFQKMKNCWRRRRRKTQIRFYKS